MGQSEEKKVWYKVLDSNLRSFNGGEFDYTPYIGTGVSLPVVADPILCRRGYHFTTDPMQWPAVGMRVFEVIVAKGDGPAEWQDDKGVFRSGRLGDERPDIIPEWWRELEAFVRSIKEAKIKPQAAAWYAAWYAASLLAACIVARDLIDPVHYEFARKNWESYLEKES